MSVRWAIGPLENNMNLMIDLETLDTKATSVIVSVGVCAFDESAIHDKQYFVLECQEQLDRGRTVSFDTLEWWFRQDKAVTDAAFNQKKMDVDRFLDGLGYFCSKNGIRKVYAQGTDFDIAMLSHIHNQYKKQIPWDFWLVRDTRTIYDMMKTEKHTREGTHHNALDDAVYQAECVIQAFKEIK